MPQDRDTPEKPEWLGLVTASPRASEAVDAQGMREIEALFAALQAWHETAREHSEASRCYMKLGSTDMQAIRYLMSKARSGSLTTPKMLGSYLHISPASVTRLLDRLESGGHVVRSRHPEDRRALSITVTPATARAARLSVGIDHARRFDIAADLSSEERIAATKFLRRLADLPIADYPADAAEDAPV